MRGEFSEIPVIDVSSFLADGGPKQRADTVAALRDALERSGFAYLSGHGMPQGAIDRLRALSQAFHALPMEAKQRIVMNEYHRGYMPFSSSTIVTSTGNFARSCAALIPPKPPPRMTTRLRTLSLRAAAVSVMF